MEGELIKMKEKRTELIKKIAKLLTQENPRIKIILNKDKTAIELKNREGKQNVEIEPKSNNKITIKSEDNTYEIAKNELIKQTDRILKNNSERQSDKNQQTVPFLLKTSLNKNGSKVKA